MMPKKLFRWVSLQPDLRKWKPSSPIFEPHELFVSLEVSDEFLTEGGHLTMEGMRYCIDQFEMQMGEKVQTIDGSGVEVEGNWDNEEDTIETTKEEWD